MWLSAQREEVLHGKRDGSGNRSWQDVLPFGGKNNGKSVARGFFRRRLRGPRRGPKQRAAWKQRYTERNE